MLSSNPIPVEAERRVARYLERLEAESAGRKAQFCLDAIAEAWGPERHSCFGHGKRHVEATASGIMTVAREAGPSRPTQVRIAALAALVNAGPAAQLAAFAVREALGDGERRIRLAAARTAAEGKLGDRLDRELRNVLGDDVWSVRWHAARAIVSRAYDSELGALARMLMTTTPRSGMSLWSWSVAVQAVRPRCRVAGQAAELDEHVKRTLAALSPRDRDFAAPLWR